MNTVWTMRQAFTWDDDMLEGSDANWPITSFGMLAAFSNAPIEYMPIEKILLKYSSKMTLEKLNEFKAQMSSALNYDVEYVEYITPPAGSKSTLLD